MPTKEEQKEATKKTKSKGMHWGWWLGIGILVLALIGLVLWLKPFTFQRRAWLKKNCKAFKPTDIDKMSSAEIATVYMVYSKYGGDVTKAPSNVQTDYNAINTKYNGLGGAQQKQG